MKINWKVRAKNKMFWLSLIPALLLLVSQVLALFGISFDYSQLSEQLTEIASTVFVILALVGIVVDPTTKGVNDSKQALKYEDPKED